MRQFLQKLEVMTDTVNATPTNWKCLFTVAVGTIFFRNWLEYLSNNSTPSYLVYNHFVSWWILVFLAIAAVNHRINKRPAEENLRWVLLLCPIICLPPLIDLPIQHFIGNYTSCYINHKIGAQYLLFYSADGPNGATMGARIEIALVSLASGWLAYNATKSICRTIFAAWATYTTIFIAAILPTVAKGMCNWIHGTHDTTGQDIKAILPCTYWMLAFLLAAFHFSRIQPAIFRALVKDLRYNRTLTYLGIATLGYLSIRKGHNLPLEAPWQLMAALLAIVLATVHAIITNNKADVKIDAISNPDRPLVCTHINHRVYEKTGTAAAAISMLLAWQTNAKVGIGVTAFLLSYAAYSMPPFRIKRIPIAGKLLIGLAGLGVYTAGAAASEPWAGHILPADFVPQFYIVSRPSFNVIAYFLLGFGMAANMIDLKDAAADKTNGIHTLANILPFPTAQNLCGILGAAAFAWSPFAFGMPWLAPLAIATGILHWALIAKRPYSEKLAIWLVCLSHWGFVAAALLG